MHDTLKVARAKRNVTLERLEAITGLSKVTINEIELGKRPPFESTKRKIERALGCRIDWTATLHRGQVLQQVPELLIQNDTDMDELLMNPGQVDRPAPEKEPEPKFSTQEKPKKRQKIWASSTMSKAEMEAHNRAIDEEGEGDEELLLPPTAAEQDRRKLDLKGEEEEDEILIPPMERKRKTLKPEDDGQ